MQNRTMQISEKVFLVGNIVTLAAQEGDTELLDLIYKLLALNGAEGEEVSA